MNRIVVILGVCALIATYVYCTIDQTTAKGIVIVWSDQNNPPEPGFEQHVDMYYSTHRDTVYMERSYGPSAE